MTATTHTLTGRIELIDRLRYSNNGNPRYQITLSTNSGVVTYRTAADHAFCDGIGSVMHVGDLVSCELGGRGTIIDMGLLSTPSPQPVDSTNSSHNN